MLVLNAFWHLWTFKERDSKRIGFPSTSLYFSQEGRKRIVPANPKAILPATEHRISWLQLEHRVSPMHTAWPVSGSGDIPNIIGEIWINAA